MTGIEYIQRGLDNGGAKYKHLRSLLQEIWNIQYKHADQRFDIDQRFQYDSAKLSNYIAQNASDSEINRAHNIVVEYYRNRGRGRPKGSRNKNHVIESPITIDYDLGQEVVTTNPIKEVDEIRKELKDDTQKLSSNEYNKLRDLLCEYAKLSDLEGFVTENGVQRVVKNLETALRAHIDSIKLNQPTIIELKRTDLPSINLGVQHKCLPLLVATVNSRLRNGNRVIPWVYGPAGTGKSVASEKLAEILGLKYYVMGTTLTKFEVTGFINTSGYQTTPFREAYEHGGVFCGDEMDSWTKEATTALNNGLANGAFQFPDKLVKRHPDFVMVACANTTGAGATLDYVGRNKLDGATLNRFAYIYWPHDDALEDSLCANKNWLEYVRRVRTNVARSSLNPKPLITTRATIFGETLLNSGLEMQTVIDMCLRQGLSDTQWNTIK